MNTFTIVIPAYDNDNALFQLLCSLERSKAEFNVIVILDGYKSVINYTVFDLNLSVYHIKNDIPWNQPQAKNLGAHFIKTEWIYFIDIDLTPTIESLLWINKSLLYVKSIYFPSRIINGTNEKIDDAKGSYLISRYSHKKISGFDERFCGTYGHDDSYYIWKHVRLMGGVCVRNTELEVTVNMSHGTKMPRDTTINTFLLAELQRNERIITNTFNIDNINYKKIL